ncbi:MAG: DUF4340 domain-containing protein [Phycisphaerales bacterium]
MNWRTVGGLWILAIVLAAVAIMWQRLAPAAGVVATRANSAMAVFGTSSAVDGGDALALWPDGEPESMRLVRDGEPERRYARNGDGNWNQIAPLNHPVDSFSVQRTARLLANLRAIDRLSAAEAGEVPDAVLGLDPPRARLSFTWPGGAEVSVALGRRGIGGRAYARLAGGDETLVVGQELHDRAVAMDPREWRDRAIFGDVAADSASSVTISTGPNRVRLERDRREWRLREPVDTRVSPAALDELLRTLAAARLSGFILDQPPDTAAFGLVPPAATVELALSRPGQEEPEIRRLFLGAEAGAGTTDRFAMVEGRDTVIRVPGRLVQVFARDPVAWASLTAVSSVPADVGRVRILRPNLEIVLRREGEGWKMAVGRDGETPGAETDIPRGEADRLLDLLGTVQAAGIQSGRLTPEVDAATVVIEDFAFAPLGTVRIAADPSGIWVMDSGEGVLRVYPEGIAPPLDPETLGGRLGDAGG